MGLLARLRRPSAPPPDLDPADPGLVVVADAADPAVADSAVLEAARARGVDLAQPLLVRHRVTGLAEGTDGAAAFAAGLDGSYRVLRGTGTPVVLVSRTELVTAMSLARERSRMAGLAQRCGGDVAGYELLAPPGSAAPR